VRLTVLRHYEQSRNISLTCRHFGISRPAFYRWQASYNRVSLHGLEDRSHRPHRVILPTWSTAQAIAVRKVREQYPYMGKRKVQVCLNGVNLRLKVGSPTGCGKPGQGLLTDCEVRQHRRQRPARSAARRSVLVVVLPSLFDAMQPGLDGGAGRSLLARTPAA